MAFTLTIAGRDEPITLDMGETLFILGANGTGKSALLQRFATQIGMGKLRRISATRQTWFASNGLDFTPSQKESHEYQIRNWDIQTQARYVEQQANIRTSLAIYDLIDAENVNARAIAAAMRAGETEKARELALKTAPIETINELLIASNIPVTISVAGNDQLMASKNGGPLYRAAELSDGERNALLVGAEVLTAKPGIVLLIDEPERHFHRAIVSPLLTHLFKYRPDCAFIVATHEILLPVDSPDARTLLVRGCTYQGSEVASWDVDLVPANADIDEGLKRDIVGSRRRVIFVEGDELSLDRPLYSVLFPQVSIRPKRTSRDVEHAVHGIRSSEALHWVKAWGIIDNDGRSEEAVQRLKESGIFALPFYSVESIYYHPDLIRRVAERQAAITGEDGATKAAEAVAAAIQAVRPHLNRLAARAAEKSVRDRVTAAMPTLQQIERRETVNLNVDTAAIVQHELKTLNAAADDGDWLLLATRCPIRETQARDEIARRVGLQNRFQYEGAVLQTLRDDPDLVATVRRHFGDLPSEVDCA